MQWLLALVTALATVDAQLLHFDISHVPHARNTTLSKRGALKSVSIRTAISSFTIPVRIGSPYHSSRQMKHMLLDTSSSLLAFGGHYNRQKSSIDLSKQVFGSYASDSFNGKAYRDDLTLPGNLTVHNTTIVHISRTEDEVQQMAGVFGIFGLGPRELTRNQVQGLETIDTPLDTMVAQGLIAENAFSLYLEPVSTLLPSGVINGALTLGGIPPNLPIGALTYHPRYKGPNSHATRSWSIEATQFRASFFNTSTQTDVDHVLSKATTHVGTLDSGSSLTFLPSDVFDAYVGNLLNSRVEDNGLLVLDESDVKRLGNLTIIMNGQLYALNRAAQIVPPAIAAATFGIKAPKYVSVFAPSPHDHFDFVLGQYFFMRWFTTFEKKRVGIAQTRFTYDNEIH